MSHSGMFFFFEIVGTTKLLDMWTCSNGFHILGIIKFDIHTLPLHKKIKKYMGLGILRKHEQQPVQPKLGHSLRSRSNREDRIQVAGLIRNLLIRNAGAGFQIS